MFTAVPDLEFAKTAGLATADDAQAGQAGPRTDADTASLLFD